MGRHMDGQPHWSGQGLLQEWKIRKFAGNAKAFCQSPIQMARGVVLMVSDTGFPLAHRRMAPVQRRLPEMHGSKPGLPAETVCALSFFDVVTVASRRGQTEFPRRLLSSLHLRPTEPLIPGRLRSRSDRRLIIVRLPSASCLSLETALAPLRKIGHWSAKLYTWFQQAGPM